MLYRYTSCTLTLLKLFEYFLAQAIAFSIKDNNEAQYGPQLAIDEQIKNGFYHSGNVEDTYPWHMTVLPHPVNLHTVTIYNRHDCCGYRLKDVEVRAGMTKITEGFNGRLTQNTLCGTLEGPGKNGVAYDITCTTPIPANVVTVQIVGRKAGVHILALDELEFTAVEYSG